MISCEFELRRVNNNKGMQLDEEKLAISKRRVKLEVVQWENTRGAEECGITTFVPSTRKRGG